MTDNTIYVYVYAKIDGAKYGCLVGKTEMRIDYMRLNYTISDFVNKDEWIYVGWEAKRDWALQALIHWWNADRNAIMCDFNDDELAQKVYICDSGVCEAIIDRIHRISEHEKLDMDELNFWNKKLLARLNGILGDEW